MTLFMGGSLRVYLPFMAQSSSKIWRKGKLLLPRQATDMPLALRPARPAPAPALGTNPASLGSSVPASVGGEETLRIQTPRPKDFFGVPIPFFRECRV